MTFVLNFSKTEQKILDYLEKEPMEKYHLIFSVFTDLLPAASRDKVEEVYEDLLEMGFIKEETDNHGDIITTRIKTL